MNHKVRDIRSHTGLTIADCVSSDPDQYNCSSNRALFLHTGDPAKWKENSPAEVPLKQFWSKLSFLGPFCLEKNYRVSCVLVAIC